jgi:hypothetical protein
MAPGRKSLRRLQIGKEGTAGTRAAATIRLRFQDAVIEDVLEVQELEEQVGIIGGVDRTAIVKTGSKVSVGSQPITFEQLPYILAMSLGCSTTATSSSTTSSDRVFLVNLPVTTAATPLTYTFEGGDDHEVEQATYMYCNKWTLDGKGGAVLNLSAEFMGRAVSTAAGFTTTAALRSCEDILFSKGKVYLDAISGSFGATQISNQVIAANIDVTVNIVPKWTADGSLDFSQIVYVDQTITGNITFEHDTAVDGSTGAKLDWRAQTPKLLRLMWQGTQLTTNTGVVTTGASAYNFKTLLIDLPVKWKAVGGLEDDSGNDLITAEFRSRYSTLNSTAGNGRVLVCLDPQGVTTGTLLLP